MKVVGIDCEMVGAGPGGKTSVLARVSVVDQDENVLLDSFVSTRKNVTDYRTEKSGVRPEDLVGAPDLSQVRRDVIALLKDRIVVGHEVQEDFKVLRYFPPAKYVRNSTCHLHDFSTGRTPSLKALAERELGLIIQTGEHSPVEVGDNIFWGN